MTIYTEIASKKTSLSVLIDPDKTSDNYLKKIIYYCNLGKIDLILIGGSIVSKSVDEIVINLKKHTKIPIVLFPGHPTQMSYKANGILFLSLISGRNPDYLIGNQVIVAKKLKTSNLEVIPTGYILIAGTKISTTEYISNTRAIPENKTDIIVATAIAGELLGLKAIYLEAGSGAEKCLNTDIILKVKKNINIPLIIGGGIKNKNDFEKIKNSGANMIVVGNAVEENPDLISELK